MFVLDITIVKIVYMLAYISTQPSPRYRESFHAIHMPSTRSSVGILIGHSAMKPYANEFRTNLVMRNARIAA